MKKFRIEEKTLLKALKILVVLDLIVLAIACGDAVFSSSKVSSKLTPFWRVEAEMYSRLLAAERKLEPAFYTEEKVKREAALKFGSRVYDPLTGEPTPWVDDSSKIVKILTDPSSDADILFEKELSAIYVSEYCVTADGYYIGFRVRELGLSVKESGDPDGIVWIRFTGVHIMNDDRPKPVPVRSAY